MNFSRSEYCEFRKCGKITWLKKNRPEGLAKTREALLKYCGLDTLATVKLREALKNPQNERKNGAMITTGKARVSGFDALVFRVMELDAPADRRGRLLVSSL